MLKVKHILKHFAELGSTLTNIPTPEKKSPEKISSTMPNFEMLKKETNFLPQFPLFVRIC